LGLIAWAAGCALAVGLRLLSLSPNERRWYYVGSSLIGRAAGGVVAVGFRVLRVIRLLVAPWRVTRPWLGGHPQVAIALTGCWRPC